MTDKLPLPRLQLRWCASTIKPACQWECHYELVMPLGEFDIRREVISDDGKMTKTPMYFTVKLKDPCLRGSSQTPCTSCDGSRFCDTPFRDGAHAHWDSEALGGVPVYVIAPDGMAFKDEEK